MNIAGIIRKISIGDIKEGITYKVGQSMLGGKLMIEQILRDTDTFPSLPKYDIYVTEYGSNNVRLWKEFIGQPTSIEYDINVDSDETI